MAGKGPPFGSAWLSRGAIDGSGRWSLLYRQGYNSDGDDLTALWNDWVFEASAAAANYTLTGAVSFTLTPSASFDIDRAHVLAGAVTFTLTPSASFDIDRQHTLSGAVTLTLTPAAAMSYTPAAGSNVINGDVTFTLTPAAAFDIDRQHVLAGAVTLTMTPAASMQYTPVAVPEPVVLTPVGTSGGAGHAKAAPKKKKRTWREELIIEQDQRDVEDLVAMLDQLFRNAA